MKLQPIRLNPVPSGNARSNEAAAVHSSSSSPLLRHTVTGNGNNMDHRLSFLNHPDLFWRYGQLAFSPASASTYPPCEFQHPLPTNLACDPRLWNKEDVLDFLQWCEEEFDIPRFDRDLFQMNGRALCLLQKQDLGERCPGYGDVIHNVLGCLIRESYSNGQHLPQSPITPHFPITPSWCLPVTPQEYTHATTTTSSPFHNSVTSSPATSGDSQSGSPKQPDQSTSSAFAALSNGKTEAYRNGTTHSSNNYGNSHSDSDVSDGADMAPSPSSIPLATSTSSPPYSPRLFTKSSSGQIFFPSSENASSTEPNTNGRLLWDFLQQLLNDSLHRYSKYITWKNRDSGVFKIVDPPGLAKLWGIQKNHLSMNYDKMSRALRYYYRVNILRKVQGERHCYQFLRNPTELKNIKNISMLKHQISPSFNQLKVKPEPPEPMDESTSDDIGPTDLSINQNSNNRLQDPLRQVKVENDGEDFQYPQDLSVGPVQLQLNMEAREAFGRHSDSLDSANNSVSSQIQIKVEDTNS